jgi:Tc toxin complex TcA C-terminal TcB-binding domain
MQASTPGRDSPSAKQVVEAGLLGSARVPAAVREKLVRTDATPLHELPKDTAADAVLSRVENLLGKGHFGAALREAAAMEVDHPLAGHYQFLRQEKLARAHIGIADRYFLRGERVNARRFYERAIEPQTSDPTVKGVAELAGRVFDELSRRRRDLLDRLKDSIRQDDYARWCESRSDLGRLTVLDVADLRQRIVADFRLEPTLGERPPIDPDPGYVDPIPAESEFIDFDSAVPGATFRAATATAVDVDLGPVAVGAGADGRLRASLAMPTVAGVLTAKARLFALDAGLTPAGRSEAVVPLFRYEHLRDKAGQIIAHIQRIESRMLPIQFELDDFAEVVDAVRRPLAEQEAELEAVNQRINELTQALAALAQAERAVNEVVVALRDAEDECECDWWCWVVAILSFAAAAAIIAVFAVAAAAAAPVIGAAFFVALGLSIPVDLLAFGFVMAGINTITCNNVGEITNSYEAGLAGLRQALAEVEAELTHALASRDALVASINALSGQLSEVYAGNEARLLDAKTLDAIQAQYNQIRQSLLTRAQVVAKLAEDAFNFERDSEVHVIKDAYFDEDRKGYTSVESLLRDLGGLDYIDITGRTQKAIQLSHTVSLPRHYPMSFVALRAAGRARFTTELREFDRWFPGTYLQRIKEVQVEVLVDGQPVPARGYLSNDGVSLVRFADPGNKRRVDDVHVFAEPDSDLARLCYKRFQRRRHVDTMAFPAFASYLHEDRMRQLQLRERNFFENVGLESSWLIELLPDQPFDLARITDVRLSFQYEALFDENLKRVLEQKRYVGRRETAALSARMLLEKRGRQPDFGEAIELKVGPDLFEAAVVDRTIVNVGFLITPKGEAQLGGAATLEVSYEGAAPIQLETNESGIVATASGFPTGTGLAELEAMAHDKPLTGTWTVTLVELPQSLEADNIDDVVLLLNYEYST